MNKRISRAKKMSITMKNKTLKDSSFMKKLTKNSLEACKKKYDLGKTKMPHNISERKDGGYNIMITRNGKRKITSVQGKNISKEELLSKAIKVRDELISQLENDKCEFHIKKLDHNNNPLPKGIKLHKARDSAGFRVSIKSQGKKIEKSFTDSSLTMDKKLALALLALEKLKNQVLDTEL
jgi:hypothetical protein